VLVHGFGEDLSVWKQQVSFLEKDHRLIIPGIPGSGLSDHNPQLSSLDDFAAAIKFILDAEGINVCTMFGHSMGGYITLAFAEHYPEALDAFGLLHSSTLADNEEKIAVRKKSIAFIEANGSAAYFKKSVPNLFTENWQAANPTAVEELIATAGSFLPEAVIQQLLAMIMRPDRTAVLKTFRGPVLFIIGREDKAVPFEGSMQQCYLPAESHIHILRNSGHMGMWEEAEKTNAALTGFLAAVTR
jgi:pimeloyl-ACP methyl ester carboxylesterase